MDIHNTFSFSGAPDPNMLLLYRKEKHEHSSKYLVSCFIRSHLCFRQHEGE